MTRIPVIQKVNQLLASAIQAGVSDIHFEPFETTFKVRYRIDGMLSTFDNILYAQKDELISRIKIMADLDIAEERRPQNGKITFKYFHRVSGCQLI